MLIKYKEVFSIFILFFVIGCGTKVQAPDPDPKFSFDSTGINIWIQADQNLNLYDENPHTLVLVIYQFTDANIFSDLSSNKPGIIKLLKGENFDQSITSVRKVIIQPGDEKTIKMPRTEGAKSVGIVAGYYKLSLESVTRLFDIPILEKTTGFISKTKTYTPEKLFINLYLGASEINRIGG